MSEKPDTPRVLATNRKARHEFEILEELECGLVLRGTEVKSLRGGRVTIEQAYAHFRGSELFLIDAHIPEYAQGNLNNHAPTRERKLLAHRRQLEQWSKRVRERGFTLVPLALYFKGPRVKVLIGLAKGKKQYDKRAALRDRDDKREAARALARRRKDD